jgi:Mg2+/Co2+ transporter CorB
MTQDVVMSIAGIGCLILGVSLLSWSRTGLAAASRSKLADLAAKNDRHAIAALKLLDHGNNTQEALGFAVLSLSALAIAFATYAANQSAVWSALIACVLVVVLHVASLLPKAIAKAYPERASLATARIARIVVAVFSPVTRAISWIGEKMAAVSGIKSFENGDQTSTRDELRGAIDFHHKEGGVVKKDKDMLGGVLDLKELQVHDVMVHRTKMVTIDADHQMSLIVDHVLKSGHSRLPVWRETPDNVIGILHARSLFAEIQKNGGDASKVKIGDVMTDPWFVPDTRPLESQLAAFLRRKTHFALVVDEYGDAQGIVTLEDIMEEIVGDIKDEFDRHALGLRKNTDGSFTIDGDVPLRDLNRAMDWELPDDEATTLAGLVIHEAKAIPHAGDVFRFLGFEFEILKRRKQQIVQIRVKAIEPNAAQA